MLLQMALFHSFLWLSHTFFREGNGNPLQFSFLENPVDRGAWWANVHGVTRVGHDVETKLLPSPPDPPAKGILVLG